MISQEYQLELRKQYNPDGSELRNLQLRLLEILRYIDLVCQRENISYWLSSGNVLGLIRHGGFIPWDDDVDIEMKREDYLRLRNIIVNDPTAPFQWQDAGTEKYYHLTYAKLRDRKSEITTPIIPFTKYYEKRGIFVDIFQLEKSTLFMTKYSTLMRMYAEGIWQKLPSKFKKKGILCMKTFFLSILYPLWSTLNKPFCKHENLYQYPSSVMRDFKPRKIDNIFPTKRAVFEGIEVNIPGKPEKYLQDLYGNWQEMPPANKRKSHFNPDHIKLF